MHRNLVTQIYIFLWSTVSQHRRTTGKPQTHGWSAEWIYFCSFPEGIPEQYLGRGRHAGETQAVLILIHAKGYLACSVCLFIKGLSPRCNLHCFDLLFTKQVAQVCLVEYFQLYQTPTLSIQRCYTCETHGGQTAAAIIYVFFHSATLQILHIPSCKIAWTYLQSSLQDFCPHHLSPLPCQSSTFNLFLPASTHLENLGFACFSNDLCVMGVCFELSS